MVSTVSYASADDVAARWRSLSTEDASVAAVLCQDASMKVRREYPNTDQRIEDGDLAAIEVTAIVAGMVKRALISREQEGMTQFASSMGPFSESGSYANPTGNLYLTAGDRATLSETAEGSAFAIDLTPSYSTRPYDASAW